MSGRAVARVQERRTILWSE